MILDYMYKIKEITKIYDGDTITVDIDLGFGITKSEKIRLFGIDTPELRGDERPEGLISRDYLIELYENNKEYTFYIKTIKDKKGKYGRYLGILYYYDEVMDNKINVNEHLIQEGYAKIYDK